MLIGHDLSGLYSSPVTCRTPTSPVRRSSAPTCVGSRFDCATLFACDFRQANLENASMARADVRGCFFAGAVLVGANLFEADLRPGAHVMRDQAGDFRVLAPQDAAGARLVGGLHRART